MKIKLKMKNKMGIVVMSAILFVLILASNASAEISPTHYINIDCTGVSLDVKVDDGEFITAGQINSVYLEEGQHQLYAKQIGVFAEFEVFPSGVVAYDVSYELDFLLGAGSSTLHIIGHSITLNCSEIDLQLAIGSQFWDDGYLGWLESNTSHNFNLISSFTTNYRLFCPLTREFAFFYVATDGTVFYDSKYEGVTLTGTGTSTLKVTGYPITLDATDIDLYVSIGSGNQYAGPKYLGWTKARETKTYRLIANEILEFPVASCIAGAVFAYFSVTTDGVVSYDSQYDGGYITGQGTSTITVVGRTITVDTSDIDLNISIGYPNAEEKSAGGYMNARSFSSFNLVAHPTFEYPLYSRWGATFGFFKLDTSGIISYDSQYEEVILTGEGTSTLKVRGHPITLDASDIDVRVMIGSPFDPRFDLGWTMPHETRTYNLIANTLIHYGLFESKYRDFAYFWVDTSGNVVYDPIDDPSYYDGVISGEFTNTIKVIGHPVLFDATEMTIQSSITSPSDAATFLGYVEPGETRIYNLVAETLYPYIVCAYYTYLGDLYIYGDNTCTPNVFESEYGTIYIYPVSPDSNPPETQLDLEGTTGNNEWYISDVMCTLSATDDDSGVDFTEFSYDNMNWIEFTEDFLISDEGTTDIYYRSIDNADNVESTQSESIHIDKTSPVTEIQLDQFYVDEFETYFVTSNTQISLNAFDGVSGLEETYYSVNEEDWTLYSGPFSLNGNPGIYQIEYYSTDSAGNIEGCHSLTVSLLSLNVESYISQGDAEAISNFDLIFTKVKQTGEYRLVATNPGQIFYHVELTNTWPTTLDNIGVELALPSDFVMKGTEPISVCLDGIDITTICIIDGFHVTIPNIPVGAVVEVRVHLDYALKGTYYPSIEEFGMKGYLFNSYVNLAGEGLSDTCSAQNTFITHQKKTTAIAGYIFDSGGNPILGVQVELWQNGELVEIAITDEFGFYYFIDIPIGEYEVRTYIDGVFQEMQVAVASKDELTEVDFIIP